MYHLLARLLRYAITGGAAAVTDAGGFALLTGLQVPVAPSAALSFVVAALVNYTLTSRYVFILRLSHRRLLLFLAAALVGLSINVSVTLICANAFGLVPLLAKIIGIGTAFFINFAMNAGIVFSPEPGSLPSSEKDQPIAGE